MHSRFVNNEDRRVGLQGYVTSRQLGQLAAILCACSVGGLAAAQAESAPRPVAQPRTYEDAIQVRYPAELAEVERVSAELGVVPPSESARAIRALMAVQRAAPSPALEGSEVIWIGPQRFTPPKGLDQSLRQRLEQPDRAESVVCVVQFARTPRSTEAADVLDMGVIPYFSASRLGSVARVPSERVAELADLPFVRWVGPYTPEYKVSNADRRIVASGVVRAVLPFYVWPLAKQDAGRGPALAVLGATKLRYDPIPNVYIIEASVDAFLQTARLDWVGKVELAKYIGMCQNFEPENSRELITAPDVWYAFDGSGTRVGTLDTGIWAAHPDFANAIAWQFDENTGQSATADTNGHGTHVAGIIAGRGASLATAKGVAPGAQLYIVGGQSINLGQNIWGYDLDDAFARLNQQSVPLVNNSWGTRFNAPPDHPWNFGYDSACQFADAYADSQGMTLVFSAGNEGPDSNSITEPSVAKNVITVGALSYTVEGDTTPQGVARVAWYSSRGPTADDARLKPEVVAPGGDTGDTSCDGQGYGFGVVSTNAQDTQGAWLDCSGDRWGANPPEDSYTRMCGTSMAAPHVTGVGALLYQAYGQMFQNDDGLMSRDIKALLVANAIPVHTYGTDPHNGYANTDTGYGLVDAYFSLFDVPHEKVTLLWAHGGVTEWISNSQSWHFSLTSAARQLVAVMCYEDDAGEQNDAHALKDDLDLTLTAPNGAQFTYALPAGVTTESPLEKIVVENPSAYGTGQWTATVTGAEWDNWIVDSQRYTLLVTAYFVDPYAPAISLAAPTTVTVVPGQQFTIDGTVTNSNGLTAAGVTAQLTGSPVFGGDIGKTKFVGNIAGRYAQKPVVFSLVAPSTPGTYSCNLSATGVNRGMQPVSTTVNVEVGQGPVVVPPQVLWTSPVSGGPQVSPGASIEVFFSHTMAASTFTPDSLLIVGSASGTHWGTVSLDPTRRRLTFFPSAGFVSGELVTVSLNSGIQSIGGSALAPYTFSFHVLSGSLTTQNHTGALTQNETWGPSVIHVITGTVSVPAGRVLTVLPGTIVKFQPSNRLLSVDGVLNVDGAPDNMAIFTSWRDDLYGGDTNADGSTTLPAAGDWGRISFTRYTAPGSMLSGALISYGGYSASAGYSIDVSGGADVALEGCVIANSNAHGVTVAGSTSALRVHACTVRGCTNAVNVASATSASLSQCRLVSGTNGCSVSDGTASVSDSIISDFTYGAIQRSPIAMSLSGSTLLNNTYPIDQGAYDVALSGNVMTGNTNQAVVVGGTLAGDVLWENLTGTGVVYLVNSALTVPAGRTLTIAAGTVVKVAPSGSYYAVTVSGVLDAQGTAAAPVVFTSARDDSVVGDTNGDGTATGPATTDWWGLKYDGSTPNTLHDVVLRYGGYWNSGSSYDQRFVRVTSGADLTVRSCRIDHAYRYCVAVDTAGCDLTVLDSAIAAPSGGVGVYVTAAGVVTLTGNTITGTAGGGTGIQVAGSANVTASGNTITGTAYPIDQGAYDVALSGNVMTGNTNQSVVVGGTLAGDVLWENLSGTGAVYQVNSALTIPAGRTLTIAAGTAVKVAPNSSSGQYAVNVSGVLDAQGTAAAPVVFTSVRDDSVVGDTNSDGTATAPATTDWWGLKYDGSTPNTLHDVQLRYGGYFSYTTSDYRFVRVTNAADLTVRDCRIDHAYRYCVAVDTAGCDLTVLDSAIAAPSGGVGVYVTAAGVVTLTGNTITGTAGGGTGIQVAGSANVTASGNTITGTAYPIDQGAYDVALSGNVMTGNTNQSVVVGGTLAGDVLWENLSGTGAVYQVNSALTIPAGRTLTIAAGTAVKVAPNSSSGQYAVNVSGVLDAQGTAAAPVVFTSVRDDSVVGDTNSDGTATAPATTDWWGLKYDGSTPNTLHDVQLRYGGYFSYTTSDYRFVRVTNAADLTVRDCRIDHAYRYCVAVDTAGCDLTVLDSAIAAPSGGVGVYVTAAGVVTLTGNTITGTAGGGTGIQVAGSANVTASGNTITGTAYPIDQGAYDVALSGNVMTGNTNQSVVVGGTLAGDVLWENLSGTGAVYQVNSALTIPAGRTLTIAAGTAVKVAPNSSSGQYAVNVSGVLDAQGTAAAPVVFTSVRDDSVVGDTNSDGTATAPATTDWWGLKYDGSTPNTLHDVQLRYGGYFSYTTSDYRFVRVTNAADLTVRDCRIDHAYRYCVAVDTAGCDLTVLDSEIVVPSGGSGVYVTAAGVVTLTGNTITGTAGSGTGIQVAGSANVTASGNTVESCQYGLQQTVNGPLTGNGNTFRQNVYPISVSEELSPSFGALTLDRNSWNAIRIAGGTIDGFVRWSSNDNGGWPFLVDTDITIAVTGTLTFDGGTVVKFTGSTSPTGTDHRNLFVDGAILIENTTELPVVFTHVGDDLWGGDTDNNGYVEPVRGNWGGIVLRTRSNTLSSAMIRYAGGSRSVYNPGAVLVTGNNSSVRQCTFEKYYDTAVRVASGSQPTVNNCNFTYTGAYGVRNDGTLLVNAKDNYWGQSSGPGSVGPGSGAQVSSNVDYTPWQTAFVPIQPHGPTITSTPNTAGVLFQTYHYDLDGTATATGTGSIIWSKLLGPDEFTIGASSGLVSWFPTAPGTYLIMIQATDDLGYATQTFQVQVSSLFASGAPRVASFVYSVAAMRTVSWDAELAVVFTEPVITSPADVYVVDALSRVVPVADFNFEPTANRLTLRVNNVDYDVPYTLVLLSTITDLTGTALDGNGDGNGGDEYTDQFSHAPPGPGDFDADGDVDIDDFDAFTGCLAGPGTTLNAGCDGADMEPDGDADLADFAEFQAMFTGD